MSGTARPPTRSSTTAGSFDGDRVATENRSLGANRSPPGTAASRCGRSGANRAAGSHRCVPDRHRYFRRDVRCGGNIQPRQAAVGRQASISRRQRGRLQVPSFGSRRLGLRFPERRTVTFGRLDRIQAGAGSLAGVGSLARVRSQARVRIQPGVLPREQAVRITRLLCRL